MAKEVIWKTWHLEDSDKACPLQESMIVGQLHALVKFELVEQCLWVCWYNRYICVIVRLLNK